jgi:hypothetical protein
VEEYLMRFSSLRRIGVVAALVVAGLTTVTAPAVAAPASPAAASYNTCGGSCYAKDPYATGCINGAYVANAVGLFDAVGRQLMTIQNWYSPACGTNWGFAYTYDISAADMQTSTATQDTCMPHLANSEICGGEYTVSGSYMWTDMIVAPTVVARVCGYAWSREQPYPNGPRPGACVDA